MNEEVIEFYCGRGGWTKGFMAHGFTCRGFDIDPQFRGVYPGRFTRADVRKLDGRKFRRAIVLVASSPCEEFSRHEMPWTRARNPPPPDLGVELAQAAFRIAREAGVPLILENVRKAQTWLGKAMAHCGPFYLWGDGVPALLPREVERRFKESRASGDRARRAEIPFELADWIARVYRSQRPRTTSTSVPVACSSDMS